MHNQIKRAKRTHSPAPGPRPPAPFLLCLLLVANLQAQVLPAIAPVKPGGMPFVRSYQAVQAPPLRSPSSLRWRSLVRAGNLYLTVHDALELAIEASLDLEIERYNMVMAGWNLQRAESGGALARRHRRQCAGGQPRRRTRRSRQPAQQQHNRRQQHGHHCRRRAHPADRPGHAAARSHLRSRRDVSRTRPRRRISLSSREPTNWWTRPALILFQMREGLLTGGTVRMTYNGSYLNEAVPLDVLNPTSYISLGVSVTHQLLQGFGERVNGRFIRIQRRRAANSERVFQQRLLALVTNTLNLYWDLSVASDDLKYKQRNHDIASRFLADTERQIAAGAVPAIDRVRARSALAVQEQASLWRKTLCWSGKTP